MANFARCDVAHIALAHIISNNNITARWPLMMYKVWHKYCIETGGIYKMIVYLYNVVEGRKGVFVISQIIGSIGSMSPSLVQ